MIFTIDTEEKVQGVYRVEADSAEQAQELFEQGSVNPPVIYEAVETKIVRIARENNV